MPEELEQKMEDVSDLNETTNEKVSNDENKNTSEKENETDSTEIYRASAAIAFAVILIIIGFPLWWKTTTVYRVPLPYSRIEDLKDFDISVKLNIGIASSNACNITSEMQALFNSSDLIKANVSTFSLSSEDVEFIQSGKFKDYDVYDNYFSKCVDMGEILLLEVPKSNLKSIVVGRYRTVYYSADVSVQELYDTLQEYLLKERSMQNMILTVTSPSKLKEMTLTRDDIVRRRIPASKVYDILITVINPDPELLSLRWNVAEAVSRYIDPFISKISLLADFKVKSQWLYFMNFNSKFREIPEGWSISEDVLPYIITPVEKRLASHISENPVLNFVVYTPECSKSPLYIVQHNKILLDVQAFLSPRWGGMIFHNPPKSICHNESMQNPKVVYIDSKAVIGVILEQLRLLLGLPKIQSLPNVQILGLNDTALRSWELDFLLRIRTWEQLASARITLISLSQLLVEISNIVIDDHVGESIYKAVDNIELAAKYLHVGDIEKAFLSSKEAFLTAESAFTDPSLLALLYFPDDQKYAVYIPLFLPVMIPVLMSLKSIFKFLRKMSKNVS